MCAWLGIESQKNDIVDQESEKVEKIEENHDQKIENLEMDAFFERVLKKNKINKQYRKERRMKEHNN